MVLFRLANLLARTGREGEANSLWFQVGADRYWSALGIMQPGCLCESPDSPSGLCYLARAVAIDPYDGLNKYRLGKRLTECEQWEEAVAALSIAIESDYLSSLELHDALLNHALSSYKSGAGIEVAIADIERAIQLQPGNPWSRIRLCDFYRSERRYPEALGACEVAINLSPDLAFSYYYRGRVWHDLGRLAEARADYEKALALNPSLEAARLWLERVR